ncbi:MAG TPA: hypothetical protein VHW69_03810, partial [Rhizomicrobium sp.]|nr:hypothetical protein [Rhizomicrobium sp.]
MSDYDEPKGLLPWLPAQPVGFRSLCTKADALAAARGQDLRFLANHALEYNALHRLARSITSALADGAEAPLTRLRLGLIS